MEPSKEREPRGGPLQPRSEARAQPASPITSFEAQFVSMVEDFDDKSVLGVILFMGKVAGAHLNPAVSIAFALRGDFPWVRVPGYVVVQLISATLAAWFLQAVIGVSALYGPNSPASNIPPPSPSLLSPTGRRLARPCQVVWEWTSSPSSSPTWRRNPCRPGFGAPLAQRSWKPDCPHTQASRSQGHGQVPARYLLDPRHPTRFG